MSLNLWDRVKPIFHAAIELKAAERGAYLSEACRGDEELGAELDRLLALHDVCDGVLDVSEKGAASVPKRDADKISRHALREDEILAERFRIVRFAGSGGMGEVYEAEDLELGERVALKTLRPELAFDETSLARFKREVQLARRVSHPNVCRIFDAGRHQDGDRSIVFLTMEYVEGETLAEHLKNKGQLPPAAALPLLRGIAEALSALNEADIVHRDLKPGNVMLDPAGGETPRVVVTDFGLARSAVLRNRSDSLTTQAGQFVGTPDYMAPEQLAGERVGRYSDVYAFGVVAFEMLCGRRPFPSDGIAKLIVQKLTQEPMRPREAAPHLSPRWEEFILACLERKIEARVASPQEVLRLLDELTRADGEIETLALLRRRPSSAPAARRALIWSAAVAATTAAFVAGGHQSPTLRRSAMRQMCSFFPGSSWFCELPADKDTAILPFDVAAETPEDEALAKGLLSFLHSGLYDLYPDKGAMCLHIRGGTRSANAYGTNLTLSGRIEVADGSIRLASRLEEPPDLGADPAAAKRLLRAAETESPESKIADLVERAMLKTAQDLELQFAVERWDAWRARVPDEPAALLAHFRGLGFLDEGESTVGQEAVPVLLRAAEQFNLAIDERYAFAWAHYGLGEAYRLLFERSGDSTWASRARNAYQEAAGLDPDSASVRKGLAELAADQGDARAAVEGLAEANRMNPFDHDIQIAYAGALESVGQISRTEQVWAQALELRPNCWYGYNEIARFYLDHGRHEEAARALQTIVRLAPDHAAAHHNLAFVYIKIGRYDDAIERAADSVKLGIGPLGYSTLGRGYLAKGCTEDALLNLQHAVREAERIEEQTGEPYATRYLFWKNQGDGLVVAGRDGEAREAFTQTVNFSLEFLAERPRHRVAAAYLALALAHLGRKNEALAAVEEALSIAPQNEETLLHAATAYELVGERKLALSLLESAFAHGLYLHEVRHTSGLEEVRRDRRYLEMVARLGLDANSTADSTTIVAITGCPQRAEAGRGLRN